MWLCVTLCVWLCVYSRVWEHICSSVCLCEGQRSTLSVFFNRFLFEATSLDNHGSYQLEWTGWPMSPSCPLFWFPTLPCLDTFKHVCYASVSGSHAYMASPVLTEPVPSPNIAFDRAKYCLITTVFSIVFDELREIFLGNLASTPAACPQSSLHSGLLSCSWCESNIKLALPIPEPFLS